MRTNAMDIFVWKDQMFFFIPEQNIFVLCKIWNQKPLLDPYW